MYPNPANGQTVATLGANDAGTIYAGGQATSVPNKAAFYSAAASSNLPISQYYNNPYGVSAAELNGLRGGGSTTTNTSSANTGGVAVDPYAQFGGQAAYNAKMAGFQSQNQGILDYEKGPALDSASTGINQGILDTVDLATKAQNNINSEANQNYLSKVQGTRGVLDMINHGLQSGGVQLAAKNASNSSAGEALARAYSMLGRSQLSGVGNQFAQGQNKIANEQTNANIDLAGGIRRNQAAKAQAITSILADANNKLNYLDTVMTSASMPDRFNIAQEQQQIKDYAIAQLQHFDSELATQTAAIKPTSEDARAAAGRDLALQGTAPDNAFQYSNIAPGQFQGTGPFASQLPIFTIPSSKKQV